MKLNVICTQEEQDVMHDYATTIFSENAPVYINHVYYSNNEQEPGALAKCLSKTTIIPQRSSQRGYRNIAFSNFIQILIEILKRPNFSPQETYLSFDDENFKNFNLFLTQKGYTAFVRKPNHQNIPNNVLLESYMPTGLVSNINWREDQLVQDCLTTIFSGTAQDLQTLYTHTRAEVMRLRGELTASSIDEETLIEFFYSVLENCHGSGVVQLVYKKVNNLEITKNDLPILSEWTPGFLNQFDITKVNSLSKEDVCSYLPFNSTAFNAHSSRSWDATRALTNLYCGYESQLTIGQMAAITLINDDCTYPVENIEEKFNQKVKASILTSTQNRIQGFSLSSYKKNCSDKPFYQVIQNYTKKQAISRNGFFIPYLIPTVIFTPDSDFKLVYYYTFLLFDTVEKIVKKKISKTTLSSFITNYRLGGGSFYYDPEFYFEQLKKSFGPNTFKYSVEFLNTLQILDSDYIEILRAQNSKEPPTHKPFNSVTNALITSEPVVESTIKNKYFKFKTKFEKLTNNKTSSERELNTALRDSKRYVDDIVSSNERIASLKQEILNCEKLVQEKSAFVKASIQKLEQLSTAYHTNHTTYASLQEDYDLAVKKAFTEKKFSTNSFFNSLAEDNVKILSINFLDSDRKNKVIDNDSLQENSNLQKLTTSFRANGSKIIEVELLIDKPVKIIVDANPNKFIYAGPYLVKIQKGNLYIKLAYPNSLFGTDGRTFYVHPHASRPSFRNMLSGSDYSRACLGEAQPLIYNAFEKNDLKLIIISAMTWVCSANSSDPWGRYYKHFPTKINEPSHICSKEDSTITNSDVEEFIQNVTDEIQETLLEELPSELDAAPAHVEAPLGAEPLQETQEAPIQVASVRQPDASEFYVRYTNP